MRAFILEVARDLLATGADVSLDELAATAGIRRVDVQQYFPSMQNVRRAVAAELTGRPPRARAEQAPRASVDAALATQ